MEEKMVTNGVTEYRHATYLPNENQNECETHSSTLQIGLFKYQHKQPPIPNKSGINIAMGNKTVTDGGTKYTDMPSTRTIVSARHTLHYYYSDDSSQWGKPEPPMHCQFNDLSGTQTMQNSRISHCLLFHVHGKKIYKKTSCYSPHQIQMLTNCSPSVKEATMATHTCVVLWVRLWPPRLAHMN